jgi:hypothetical protein
MPRILVLADCDPELGDRPIMLDEECSSRALGDPQVALSVLNRVASAVAAADEVEERVSTLYTA